MPSPISPNAYTVSESAELEYANDDGSVTVAPGEQRAVVGFRPGGSSKTFHLLATEVSDAQNCQYVLKSGESIVMTTQSPIGRINEPFSYIKEFGRPMQMERYCTIEVMNMGSAEKDFVGRLHCEVV